MPNFFSSSTIKAAFTKAFDTTVHFADPLGWALGLDSISNAVFAPWKFVNGEQKAAIKADKARIKGWFAPPDMRRDREMMTNEALTARKIIYGECRVSGQIAFVESSGNLNENLHMIVLLAGHPVDSIGQVYLDDLPLESYVSLNPLYQWIPNASVVKYDGTQTAACANMVAVSTGQGRWTSFAKTGATVNTIARIGGLTDMTGIFTGMTVTGTGIPAGTLVTYVGDTYVDINNNATATGSPSVTFSGVPQRWTAAHKLQGCAYLYITIVATAGYFTAGIPKVTAVVKGKRVYDPRTGLTAWSDNPALCCRDYMTTPTPWGGMGCSDSEIDDTTNITAADICDEMVARTIDGTLLEKRYVCCGSMSIENTPKAMIDALMQSMVGTAVFSEGKWKLYAGAYRAPVATIDESWLNGGISFALGSNKNERINTVKGSFIDPTDHYALKEFPMLTSPDYVAADGDEELLVNVDLQFTTSMTACQRIGKIIMERSRLGLKVSYPCNLKAMALEPEDTVYLNNAQMGWVNKIFRVDSWSFAPGGGVNLSLSEEDPNVYNWTSGEIIAIDRPQATMLPDPRDTEAVGNLQITESLYATAVQSVLKVKIDLSWDATTSGRVIVQVDGVDYTDVPATMTTCTIMDVEPGAHTFSVIALNSIGVRGTATTVNYTVLGKLATPQPPAAVTAVVERGLIKISITPPADLDIESFLIRQGSSWNSGADIAVVSSPNNTYLYQPLTSGNLQFWVKSQDTSNLISASATGAALITVQTPDFPFGALLIPEVIGRNVLLRWTAASGTYPIECYEVRKGTDFATAAVVGQITGTFSTTFESTSGVFKYWIIAKDIAGLYGSNPLSIAVTVTQPTDFILRDSRPLSWTSGTLTNCVINERGYLLAPVNATETFQQHFDNNSWATPQDQVDAGLPVFIQPGLSPGQYVETIDYGAVMSGTKITLDLTTVIAVGTVAIATTISVKENVGDAWTDYAGVTQVYASSFRYVKITLDFTTADNGIVTINNSSLRLDLQKKYYEGSVNAVSTDATGTVVYITDDGTATGNPLFIDVSSITLTPKKGATVDTACYDYIDAPYPVSFTVYRNNSATGARTSGEVAYTVGGV